MLINNINDIFKSVSSMQKKTILKILLVITLMPLLFIVLISIGPQAMCGLGEGGDCKTTLASFFTNFLLLIVIGSLLTPIGLLMLISTIICIVLLVKSKKKEVSIVPAVVSIVLEYATIVGYILFMM